MSGAIQALLVGGSYAPLNTAAPAVTGTAQVRQTLSCSTGTWLGTGVTYAYQWYQNSTLISGATASTYLIPTAYVGTTIYCIVTATNSSGAKTAQSNTTAAVAANVALAPTIGTATKGNANASITFTPPSDNGGATITSYTGTSSPGGFTGSSATSPVVVSGLTNGTAYTFTVTAINSAGTSAPSAASNSATPSTIPGAPTIGTAVKGNTTASVAFTAPASDGGAAITSYTATSSPGGFTGTGATSPITVSGLANGT